MTPSSRRFECAGSAGRHSLQILKAVCVAGMVAVHGFYWAATDHGRFPVPESNALVQFVKEHMFLGIMPLLLPFTAGCALRFRWSGQDGTVLPVSLREAFIEAAGLAALGYVMNLAAGGWYALWSWNVLQFVALSLVVVAILSRLGSTPAVLIAGALVLALSDSLRSRIDLVQGPAWRKVLLGDPTYFHTWPFFPWFSTFAFGWVLADGMLRFRDSVWLRVCLQGALAGTGITAAGVAWHYGRLFPLYDRLNLIGPRIFLAPSVAILGMIGWAAMLTLFVGLLAPYFRPARYGMIRCFSAGILWIYVIHMTVGMRVATYVLPHIDRTALFSHPASPAALLLLLGYPAALLALSRLTGFLVIRYVHEKQIRIKIRRVQPVLRFAA